MADAGAGVLLIMPTIGDGPADPPLYVAQIRQTCPEADSIAPTVDNYDPTPGQTIGRYQALSFDVKDDRASFHAIFIIAVFTSLGDTEVVHDGTSFRARYTGSSRTPIEGGFRYTLRRTEGWPTQTNVTVPVKIETFAIDTGGNISA
jgi:hypothetical protein